MNFTIKNTLISVTNSYKITDIEVVNGKIAAIASNLNIIMITN